MQQLSMNGQVIQTDRKYLAEFHMVTRAKFLPFGLLFTVGARIPNVWFSDGRLRSDFESQQQYLPNRCRTAMLW